MSMRNLLLRAGLGIAAATGVLASPAAADSFTYNIVQDESDISTVMNAAAFVDMDPDLLAQFPTFGFLTGTSNTEPTSSSYAIADVGLPDDFQNGATGITISELFFRTLLAPGEMSGIGAIGVPLPGGGIQFVGYTAKVAALEITLDDPISSPLIASGQGEWAWAAPAANVTISGIINPIVAIPTVDPISLGDFPFSQAVTIPLAGTFSGDPSGTVLTLGIPLDALQDQTLATPPISGQVQIPGGLLPVTGTFALSGLTLVDFSAAIVYANAATPIPEPSTALLLGLGLLGIAMRRRR